MTHQPSAFLFDVFGTVVDWRSAIARQMSTFCAARGLTLDCDQFALDWRAEYQPAMEAVRSGGRGYVDLDVLHGENLDRVADRHGLSLGAGERAELVRFWHRLEPWPDSVAGVATLREIGIVAPLSNGHIALMVNLARHTGLTWDAILGAEVAQAYKPDHAVYLRGAAALGLAPEQCMMVAAHNDDLAAARTVGMQTAFVLRATEYGPGQVADLSAEQDWDVVANDLAGVAAAVR